MRLEGVVQEVIGRAVIGVGRAGDHDDRQVLGIGAGNRVDRREPADAEGHYGGGRPAGPRVPFGGIAAIEFVAAADLLQLLVRQKLVEQDEIEISRDHEVMFKSDSRQPRRKVAPNSIHMISLRI